MRTMSKEELSAKLGSPVTGGSSRLVVVDVLSLEAYNDLHIRGSVSIPLEALIEGKWRELDSGDEVVVYCEDYGCNASRRAAEFLESKGFDVRAYEGGIKEWVEAGLPTQGRRATRADVAIPPPPEREGFDILRSGQESLR